MRTTGRAIISISALLFLLTACGGGNSAVFQTEQTSPEQSFDNSTVWDIVLVPVSDEYETAAPVCGEPIGKFRTCEFNLEVTNVSRLPQTVEGIYFLETANGTVFQEINRSYDSFTGVVNPGETVLQWARFSLPIKGEVAFRMYRAWEPTGDPVISHVFETMWDVSK
jgi:hypothetical protein